MTIERVRTAPLTWLCSSRDVYNLTLYIQVCFRSELSDIVVDAIPVQDEDSMIGLNGSLRIW
jgi:hypothetical protein